jgi:putative aldouronate transport system substrate-binding protein
MKVPTNTDELEAVLKAFQDKDVNGSGKKDEYFGFTGFKKAGFTPETIIWSFGSDVNMIQDKGKVVFGPTTPEFKEGLAYLAKLYSEGLIDPEYMLNDEPKLKQKYVSNNIAGSFGSAARVVQYTALMTPKDPAAKLVPIPSLKNSKGTGYWFNENTISAPNTAICLAITTANKHVAETMAWQDWVYTKAGSMAFNFGREGDTYTMVNGQPTFTDKITKDPKGRTQSEMVNITATGQGIWPTAQDLTAAKIATPPEAWSCFELWGKNLPDTSKIKPTVTFNDAELAVVTAKRQAITDYVEQMVDRFVVGKEPLDNYEKVFLPKLKELGIDDLVKANQTALDRFNKR